MKNQLIQAMARNKRVRIVMVNTTDMSNRSARIHQMWPTATAALSRILSMISIMGTSLKKEDEKIVIHVNGNGEIGSIMATIDGQQNVKGFVANPHVHYEYHKLKKLAVGIAVGNEGSIKITKDLQMKEKFSTDIPLINGELGEEFAYYYAHSEQIPSLVALGCLVNPDNTVEASGGILIQLMPDATEEDIVASEKLQDKLKDISGLLAKYSMEEILNQLYEDCEIIKVSNVNYIDKTNRETLKKALATLPITELEAMIIEDKGCEIKDHWTSEYVHFDEKELRELVNELKGNL